tara:strand:- start:1585 stop:2493 length:909 start_codon:yes stop_codon:yes gene_type:complete
MKPQFQHEATTSFSLWLDNHLTNKLEAYSNRQADLYYIPDERMPAYPEDPDGFVSYNSEYKQWVYDSDATDASIPEGVFIDTGDGVYNFCERGQSGLAIDFENGRVLLSGAFFPTNYDTLNIKAEFAVKDINIYLSDDTEENLVIQSKLNKNSRTTPEYGAGEGLPPYQRVAPAAFVSMESSKNVPYAFGGEDLTQLFYRVVLFAEDLYQLDGFISACTDTYNLAIKNVGYENHPLNEYSDLKTGHYSYSETIKNSTNASPLMFIEDVRASKISDRLTKTTNPDLYLAFVDFEVSQARYPRI